MKVTLNVCGRQMTFSEQELIDILEKHFSNATLSQTTNPKEVEGPREGQFFEVNPETIDQSLFRSKRPDPKQEETRQIILEALAEVKNNQQRYNRKFKTLIPKQTWNSIAIGDLMLVIQETGDHMADWVEQALEWAQRICNGESWRQLCNERDSISCCRYIVGKDGTIKRVGGQGHWAEIGVPITVRDYLDSRDFIVHNDRPLVVVYEK